MIKIVKRILFRRSGTRNMFRSRDSMAGGDLLYELALRAGFTSWRYELALRSGSCKLACELGVREGASLPVGQGVALGGRATVTPWRGDHFGAPTCGFDGLDRTLRKGVGPHSEGL